MAFGIVTLRTRAVRKGAEEAALRHSGSCDKFLTSSKPLGIKVRICLTNVS
jgi:hypothetical protein